MLTTDPCRTNLMKNAQCKMFENIASKFDFKILLRTPRDQWVKYNLILGMCNLHKCWTWFPMLSPDLILLTHWGQVTHICISKLTIIGSDNGLSPKRRQAIIWTNAGILLIGSLGTNFGEILTEIHIFPLKEMHLKTKWQPFCLGLNVLTHTEAWTKWPIFCRLF